MSKELLKHICNIMGTLYLTSFWGGKDGRCVQLTTADGTYVQMTFDDARKFFSDAINRINKVEISYNKHRPWWENLSEAMEEAKTKPAILYKPKGVKKRNSVM